MIFSVVNCKFKRLATVIMLSWCDSEIVDSQWKEHAWRWGNAEADNGGKCSITCIKRLPHIF